MPFKRQFSSPENASVVRTLFDLFLSCLRLCLGNAIDRLSIKLSQMSPRDFSFFAIAPLTSAAANAVTRRRDEQTPFSF